MYDKQQRRDAIIRLGIVRPSWPSGLLFSAVLAIAGTLGSPTAVTAEESTPPRSQRVLLLPPAFTEFQNAVSGLEAIPEWTQAARENLGDAARISLQAVGLELQPLPDLTAEEFGRVHEHIAVAQLIVAAGALYGSNDWHKNRDHFDRTLGEGLRFLHERTGADYALLIDGSQVRQSGARIGMRVLSTLAAATVHVALVSGGGGGQILNVCLLDLNTGAVVWFNSSQTKNVFGSSGSDLRQAPATQAVMKELFASYPNIPALAD